jgi:hypothetical protein
MIQNKKIAAREPIDKVKITLIDDFKFEYKTTLKGLMGIWEKFSFKILLCPG